MKAATAITVAKTVGQLGPLALKVAEDILPYVSDGNVSYEDIRVLAQQFAEQHPDLVKVKVNGIDIVGPEEEEAAVLFVAGVVANAVKAARKDPYGPF